MNSARLWIVAASLVWFVAGGVASLLATGYWQPEQPEPSPMEHYTNRMITEFELDGDRARYFRVLMEKYQEEIDQVKADHIAAQAAAIEPRLRELGLRYRSHIKNYVLPEERRAEFEVLSSGAF